MNTKLSAFPYDSDSEGAVGMDLRDYFAARAMQSFCALVDYQIKMRGFDEIVGGMAEASYLVADAMLKERVK